MVLFGSTDTALNLQTAERASLTAGLERLEAKVLLQHPIYTLFFLVSFI